MQAKLYHHVALYPSINAAGLALSTIRDSAVTVEAITATNASPTALPIWLTVLKTPPARA